MLQRVFALSLTVVTLAACGAGVGEPSVGQQDRDPASVPPAAVATPSPSPDGKAGTGATGAGTGTGTGTATGVNTGALAIDASVVRFQIEHVVLGRAQMPGVACYPDTDTTTYDRTTHRASLITCALDDGKYASRTTERVLTSVEIKALEDLLGTVTYALTDACDGYDGGLSVMTAFDAAGSSKEFFQSNLNCPPQKRNVARKVIDVNRMLTKFITLP